MINFAKFSANTIFYHCITVIRSISQCTYSKTGKIHQDKDFILFTKNELVLLQVSFALKKQL